MPKTLHCKRIRSSSSSRNSGLIGNGGHSRILAKSRLRFFEQIVDTLTLHCNRMRVTPQPSKRARPRQLQNHLKKPLRRFGATAAGKELDIKKEDLPGVIFFLSFRRTRDQTPPEELPLRALGAKDTILLLFFTKKIGSGLNIEYLIKSLFKPVEVSMGITHKTLCQHINCW